MKCLIWMPLGLAVAAGAALLILRSATGQYHELETAVAAAIAILASELAMVPLILARKAHPSTLSQAALAGTVLHMFLAFALAAVAYSMKLVAQRNLFLFLILGFYWVSLVLIVVVMIRTIRRASPPAAPANQH